QPRGLVAGAGHAAGAVGAAPAGPAGGGWELHGDRVGGALPGGRLHHDPGDPDASGPGPVCLPRAETKRQTGSPGQEGATAAAPEGTVDRSADRLAAGDPRLVWEGRTNGGLGHGRGALVYARARPG